MITGDGEEREVDAIIFGTGFQVTDMPVGRMVRGPGGKTLDDVWEGSPKAHLGAAMPGFPNLFVLLGPNTGLGHSSMVYMIESQVAYVLDALKYMDAHRADTVEVSADGDRRATTPTSTSACRARCGTPAARAGTSTRPGATRRCGRTGRSRFRRRTAQFDPADFELRSTHRRRPGAGDRMRVLITGANGGIGTAAIAELRSRGATVVGLDLAATRRRRARLRRARPRRGHASRRRRPSSGSAGSTC